MALTTDPSSTRALLAKFCRALGEATGLAVRPRGVWHYHHLIEGLEDREIDVAWLPPLLALRASAQGRVVPLALPVRNGSSSYQTALFARADSTIRDVSDLKGVRAAWVDRQSAAGYLIIRAHLKAKGVDLDQAFSSDLFLGTYDGVAGAVLDGEVDVGATYAYFPEDGPASAVPLRAGWGDADVHVIARSDPIPADLVAADRRVSAELRERVSSALVDDPSTDLRRAACELFNAEGFAAPSPGHLEALGDLLAALGEVPATPHSLFPPASVRDAE